MSSDLIIIFIRSNSYSTFRAGSSQYHFKPLRFNLVTFTKQRVAVFRHANNCCFTRDDQSLLASSLNLRTVFFEPATSSSRGVELARSDELLVLDVVEN